MKACSSKLWAGIGCRSITTDAGSLAEVLNVSHVPFLFKTFYTKLKLRRGYVRASAALKPAPGDFISWISAGDGASGGNQTCFRQSLE